MKIIYGKFEEATIKKRNDIKENHSTQITVSCLPKNHTESDK